MPYYEVIYETGSHSVAMYADDEEALRALDEHHRRATNGELGGPGGAPAERVKKVLVYAEHPNEYNPEGTMSGEVATSELSASLKAPALNVEELAAEVRQLSSPVDSDALTLSRHNSQFKMKEERELEGSWS